MITFVIRQMPLQHVHPFIQIIHQPDLLAQEMDRSHSTASDRLGLVRHLIMDIAGGQHRLGLLGPEAGLEPAGNSVLAVAEDLGVASAHSKSCLFGLFESFTNSYEPINAAVSCFLFIFRDLYHA